MTLTKDSNGIECKEQQCAMWETYNTTEAIKTEVKKTKHKVIYETIVVGYCGLKSPNIFLKEIHDYIKKFR